MKLQRSAVAASAMVACAVFVAACSSSGPPLMTLSSPPVTSPSPGVQLTTRTLGTVTTQTLTAPAQGTTWNTDAGPAESTAPNGLVARNHEVNVLSKDSQPGCPDWASVTKSWMVLLTDENKLIAQNGATQVTCTIMPPWVQGDGPSWVQYGLLSPDMQHIAVPNADNSWSVLKMTDNTVTTASAGGHVDDGGLVWNGMTPAAAAPQIPATAPVPSGKIAVNDHLECTPPDRLTSTVLDDATDHAVGMVPSLDPTGKVTAKAYGYAWYPVSDGSKEKELALIAHNSVTSPCGYSTKPAQAHTYLAPASTVGGNPQYSAPVLVVGNKMLLSEPSAGATTLASIDLTSDGRNLTTVWSAPPDLSYGAALTVVWWPQN